jgi:hypothetical protein
MGGVFPAEQEKQVQEKQCTGDWLRNRAGEGGEVPARALNVTKESPVASALQKYLQKYTRRPSRRVAQAE